MFQSIDIEYLKLISLHRPNDSHKGDYGHLLLVCGSAGMPGAASLATSSALNSGCGLVTLHSVVTVCNIVAVTNPSAMLSICEGPVISVVPDLSRCNVVAVGPGLGRDTGTIDMVISLIEECRKRSIPMLLDADALYAVSVHPEILERIPKGSVMTPHEGELRRLVSWGTDKEKDYAAAALSQKTGCTIISKGYMSRIFTPGGDILQNTTGNPGMAKGGSGDVLTGLVSGLMARGYTSEKAAAMGAWIHGYTGDCLSGLFTQEAYSSRDIAENLWRGFKKIAE